MKTLRQNNFHNSLECWNNDQMPVSTGEMSECISVVFIGKEKHYGIHCGGGLNKEIAENLKKLLPADFDVQKIFVVFGFCYLNNPHSCIFGVEDAYKYFGKDCVVLCSNIAQIKSKDSFTAQYFWDKSEGTWKEHKPE